MTNTLLDLSGKIDKVTVSALIRIQQILSSIGIPFFVVGATARDILLDVSHGIESKRATIDIDIAVFIENWAQFKHLKDELNGATDFSPTRDIQRLLFKERLPVDIVPFGGVAEEGDIIEWPPDGSFKMSVTGFRECYQHASWAETFRKLHFQPQRQSLSKSLKENRNGNRVTESYWICSGETGMKKNHTKKL